MKSRAFAVALLALAGCSNGSEAPVAAVDGGNEFVPCTNDPRVDHYVAGMEKVGTNTRWKVKLLASEPAPPAKPLDVWNLLVTDANGAPASGLAMVVSPYMPDHRHAPPIEPVVTALAEPGRYDVAMINLFMAGVWQVKVNLSAAGATDVATFWFCVER